MATVFRDWRGEFAAASERLRFLLYYVERIQLTWLGLPNRKPQAERIRKTVDGFRQLTNAVKSAYAQFDQLPNRVARERIVRIGEYSGGTCHDIAVKVVCRLADELFLICEPDFDGAKFWSHVGAYRLGEEKFDGIDAEKIIASKRKGKIPAIDYEELRAGMRQEEVRVIALADEVVERLVDITRADDSEDDKERERQRMAKYVEGGGNVVYIGQNRIRVGGDVCLLSSAEDDVISSLVALRRATLDHLRDKSGRDSPHKQLRSIIKKFPFLNGTIEFPVKKGDGYATTILADNGDLVAAT